MKVLFISILVVFSMNVFSNTLTFDLTVRKISLIKNQETYGISFNEMAAVYISDKKFIKCFQKSLETKKTAKVTYLGRELKITNCEN